MFYRVDHWVMRGAQWCVDRLADWCSHFGLAIFCTQGALIMAAAEGLWLAWRAVEWADWPLLAVLALPFPLLLWMWWQRLRLYQHADWLEQRGVFVWPEMPVNRMLHLFTLPAWVLLAVCPPDGPTMCWVVAWTMFTAGGYFADCSRGTPREHQVRGQAWQHS
jgi:hypothetical protein